MKTNSIETFLRELSGSIVEGVVEIQPSFSRDINKFYGTSIGEVPKGIEYLDIASDLYHSIYGINLYATMSELIFRMLNSRIYVNVGEDRTGDFNCEAIEIVRTARQVFDAHIIETALENLIIYYTTDEGANLDPKSDLVSTYYEVKYS